MYLRYQGTETKQITAEKYPVAQAVTSSYIACTMNGEKSFKKNSVESGVSDVTIRNRVILIRKTLKQIE
jgi:transcription initiation factor TFIIB